MEWVVIIASLLAAAAACAVLARGWRTGATPAENARVAQLETQLQNESERRAVAETTHAELQKKREEELTTNAAENAALKQQLRDTEKRAEEKIALLEKVRESMGAEFKNLSQSILEEKAQKFGEDSRQLLAPLGEQLKEFRLRADQIHDVNTRAHASLQTEIRSLHDNAAKIGADANNLAAALKGDSKTQGDWGEIELAALLEKSGLREGEGYETQQSLRNEDGKMFRPDVVIHLPKERHFIVDSKVSLRAYADYTAATDAAEKKTQLTRHVHAVKKHADDLASKNYAALRGINAPDMVFMFMAVEPAFLTALTADANLFNDAYQKGVVMCSPTTLMPILRATEHLWRMERQGRNAEEIARQGGALYDKFSGFVKDMRDIEKSLDKTRESYDAAFGKLSKGRGNLISHARKLHDMGIDAKKEKLPEMELESE